MDTTGQPFGAGRTVDATASLAPSTTPGARETARNLASDAIDGAASTADNVREKVADAADRQQQRAADALDAVADSLQHSSRSMPDREAWLSDLTTRGAAQLSDFAERLRRNDLQGLLSGIDDFARGQPALFFGASMVAGFALSRVAQASIRPRNKPLRNDPAVPDAASHTPYRTTVTDGPVTVAEDAGERPFDMGRTEASHG
jgi:hypothetical protein